MHIPIRRRIIAAAAERERLQSGVRRVQREENALCGINTWSPHANVLSAVASPSWLPDVTIVFGKQMNNRLAETSDWR